MLLYQRWFAGVAAGLAWTESGGDVESSTSTPIDEMPEAIAAAELYLVRRGGATPGDPGTGAAMAAVDGAFNSTTENVTEP